MATDYRDLFAEQARRWAAQDLSAVQRVQVGAYAELVNQQQAALADILALTREIQPHTIEQIMTTSDFDLGLQVSLDSCHQRPS